MPYFVKATTDWGATDTGKLSLESNQIIEVLAGGDSGWWLGQTEDGRKGYFPSSYCAYHESSDGVDERPAVSAAIPSPMLAPRASETHGSPSSTHLKPDVDIGNVRKPIAPMVVEQGEHTAHRGFLLVVQRKTWHTRYCVLHSGWFESFKDPVVERPRLAFSTQGCTIEQLPNYPKRGSFVFRIVFKPKGELVCQALSTGEMHGWLSALQQASQETSNSTARRLAFGELGLVEAGQEVGDSLQSKGRGKGRGKGAVADTKVFGVSLDDVAEREGCPVPKCVRLLVGFLRKNGGVNVDGLFQVTGNTASVQTLRDHFNRGEFEQLGHVTDAHVASGCLKAFFRELPQPLIPTALYQSLTEAVREPAGRQRRAAIQQVLRRLPNVNLMTLTFLFVYLAEVASNQSVNRMSESNLAIVFGPTPPSTDTDFSHIMDMARQSEAIEELLRDYTHVFEESGYVKMVVEYQE